MHSNVCCERDKICQTADLARLAKLVATVLGKAQQIGVDGFSQVGAGSGGYALYENHRSIWSTDAAEDFEYITILNSKPWKMEKRLEIYREFIDFDRWCVGNRILFLKQLLVSN